MAKIEDNFSIGEIIKEKNFFGEEEKKINGEQKEFKEFSFELDAEEDAEIIKSLESAGDYGVSYSQWLRALWKQAGYISLSKIRWDITKEEEKHLPEEEIRKRNAAITMANSAANAAMAEDE